MSVMAGLSVGIALIAAFASMALPGGYSFRPDGYFDWSPEDGGMPRIWLTANSGDELNEDPFGSKCNDPDMC